MSKSETELPLTGVRVVDFSGYAPGPFVSRQLCDLGAEVIKIEPPAGDPMAGMFLSTSGASPVYQTLNCGKQIARLNLKDAGVVASVRALIEHADILIEGFRPGVMDRLGLGYDICKELNPAIVYCALTGYGQAGPYAAKAGHDINYCAAAGAFSYAKAPSLFPLIGDHSGAQNACSLILAALVGSRHGDRSERRRGRYLDVSLYEPMLGWQYLNQSAVDDSFNPLGLLWGNAACYNIYTTADQRLVTLGALEAVFWRNFCDAVAQPDWIARHLETMPQTSLIAEVSDLFGAQPLSRWQSLLDPIDCCFEPVPLPVEIFSHPQTRFRGMFREGSTGIAEANVAGQWAKDGHSTLNIVDRNPSWSKT